MKKQTTVEEKVTRLESELGLAPVSAGRVERLGYWMRRHWLLLLVLFFAGGGAVAQSTMTVNQGAPGRYGPWPVTGTWDGGLMPVAVLAGGSSVMMGTTDAGGGTETIYSTGHALNVVVTSGGGTVDYSPGVPSTVACSASTSCSICSLTPSARYRLSCGTAAVYRTGAATPTAVATDSELFANSTVDVTLKSTESCVAFYSAGTPTCKASLISAQ